MMLNLKCLALSSSQDLQMFECQRMVLKTKLILVECGFLKTIKPIKPSNDLKNEARAKCDVNIVSPSDKEM